jgi:hypothetical protein
MSDYQLLTRGPQAEMGLAPDMPPLKASTIRIIDTLKDRPTPAEPAPDAPAPVGRPGEIRRGG